MGLTRQAEAILLLTVRFGRTESGAPRPLGLSEWGRFASWLRSVELEPSDLMEQGLHHRLAQSDDSSITRDRIEQLLARGSALALAVERWERAGIWVMVRSDLDYPVRLKERLGSQSPPVLFGCGNRRLVAHGGIAIIGSRSANEDSLRATEQLGRDAANQGFAVLSGGARGVDEAAIRGALAAEGTAIAILPADLLRLSTSPKYREAVMKGELCLVSPFNPDSGFTAGNAMARNRYIYCLADGAVVMEADSEKGGTWSGAVEDLRAGWVPLWIRTGADPSSGTRSLLERGAHPLPKDQPNFHAMLKMALDRSSSTQERVPSGDAYETFLKRFNELRITPASATKLSRLLKIERAEVSRLLAAAVADGLVVKIGTPPKYSIATVRAQQTPLFDD